MSNNIRETFYEQAFIYCTKTKLDQHAADIVPGRLYYTTDTKQQYADIAYIDGNSTVNKRVCFDSVITFDTYDEASTYITTDASTDKLYFIRPGNSDCGLYCLVNGQLQRVIGQTAEAALTTFTDNLSSLTPSATYLNKIIFVPDNNGFSNVPYNSYITKQDGTTYSFVKMVPSKADIEDLTNEIVSDSFDQLNDVLLDVQANLESLVGNEDGGFRDTGITTVLQQYAKKNEVYTRTVLDSMFNSVNNNIDLKYFSKPAAILRKDCLDSEAYPGGALDTDPAVIYLEDKYSSYLYHMDTNHNTAGRATIQFNFDNFAHALDADKTVAFELILHNANQMNPTFGLNMSWLNSYEPEYIYDFTSIIFMSVDQCNTWVAAYNGGWSGNAAQGGTHDSGSDTDTEIAGYIAQIEAAVQNGLMELNTKNATVKSNMDTALLNVQSEANQAIAGMQSTYDTILETVDNYAESVIDNLASQIRSELSTELETMSQNVSDAQAAATQAAEDAADALEAASAVAGLEQTIEDFETDTVPTLAKTDFTNVTLPHMVGMGYDSTKDANWLRYKRGGDMYVEQYGTTAQQSVLQSYDDRIYGFIKGQFAEIYLPVSYDSNNYNIQFSVRLTQHNATWTDRARYYVIDKKPGSFVIGWEADELPPVFSVQIDWVTRGFQG